MKKPAFILACVLLALAALELVCRTVFSSTADAPPYMQFTNPHRQQSGFVPDDDLFWKLAPGNAVWEVNEDGFRGPPASRPKAHGEFRVVALGDSCTFGLGKEGVPYEKTWPAVLERLLAEARPERKVRALNFGCPGYTSFQGLRLYRTIASTYEPDVVVAYFGINDGFDAVGFTDKDQRPLLARLESSGAYSRVLRRSALYRTMTRLVVGARRAASDAAGAPLERVGLADYHANLDAIAALAKSRGAVAFFIAPPYLEENGALNWESQRLHNPSVDIMPSLRAALDKGDAVIFPAPDNVHPTPAGHAAIARAVAEKFIKAFP